MFKKSILVCAVFLIAYSMVECGSNSNSESDEGLSSAEKKLNRFCRSSSRCDNREYGLECIDSKCA